MTKTQKLSSRIRKARAWLTVNCQSYCQDNGKVYNPKKWANSLRVYEELVDECPMSEKDCWSYDGITSDMMEEYEVEYLMNIDNQTDNQLELDNSNKGVKPQRS